MTATMFPPAMSGSVSTHPQSISPHDLAARLDAGEPIRLVDVRTPAEFAAVHASAAINVPLDELTPARLPAGDGPLFVICKSGSRSASAQKKLASAGVESISVEGGTDAWTAAGLDVERSSIRVMSLDRQVRIAAGSIVLIGVALGALVNPWLYGLSAFVGAGLVFAGVTDFCGMAILLGKMPWNRRTAFANATTCSIR